MDRIPSEKIEGNQNPHTYFNLFLLSYNSYLNSTLFIKVLKAMTISRKHLFCYLLSTSLLGLPLILFKSSPFGPWKLNKILKVPAS